MFKVRSVLFLMIAALIVGFVEYVGLYRLGRIWNARASETDCPALPAAIVPAPAPVPAEPPRHDVSIGVLAVNHEFAELVVDGRRFLFPGYPHPRSKDHTTPFLTAGVVAPGADLVAIAGICYGYSGVTTPRVPSCARTFVRLYRVDDGTHVRDLRMPWENVDDSRRVTAMAFDARAERLAVLVHASWSDCSWGGDEMELVVYRLADGARLVRRGVADRETSAPNEVFFQGDEVHVTLGQADGSAKVRTVRLPR